ncbi:hypothetical protein H3C66_03095 [Patescibacteria group bacterium]|nr:hypothetical protein [Patescibacteria group bacterium]
MHQENPQFWDELRRINKLLGGDVIGIETGGEAPESIRVDFGQLEQNLTLKGGESAHKIHRMFRDQALGLRALLQLVELAGQDRWRVRLELLYTQALLGFISIVVRVVAE